VAGAAGRGRGSVGLRYLRGGTAGGCYYPTERTSNSRLVLHMLVFYGFVNAFAATIAAFVLQDSLASSAVSTLERPWFWDGRRCRR